MKTKETLSIVAVGVPIIILDSQGRILLVKRVGRTYQGFWGIPSETVQPGETLEEAVRRGAREELDIEVYDIRFTGHCYDAHGRDPRYATAIDHPHVCHIAGGIPIPKEEASEVQWFLLKEVALFELPYDQKQMLIDAELIEGIQK